jgi:DNA polymerase (family 10)
MEIDGADSFRIRSYRRAAEAAEQTTVDLAEAANDTARLLAIDGIGKGMAAHLQSIAATGTLPLRDELLAKYGAGVLELLKLPGMGPKTVALLWDAAKIGTIDQLAEAIAAGRLKGLPRMGDKQIQKLQKGIEDYRRSAGRFRIDVAEEEAGRIAAYLLKFKGIKSVTPAGSLRRGRETIGDLDLLVTGPACAPEKTGPAVEYVAAYPGIQDMIAKGDNKVSFHVDQGLQVDVRLLPEESYGAALQYFTGSKAHNVTLRQRALKMGYTLSEWALARLDDGTTVAAATEEEIYADAAGDAREPGRDRRGRRARFAPCGLAQRYTRRRTHAHHRKRRAQLDRRDGGGGAGLRVQVHRDHRPLKEPGHDQRPRREAGARTNQAGARDG